MLVMIRLFYLIIFFHSLSLSDRSFYRRSQQLIAPKLINIFYKYIKEQGTALFYRISKQSFILFVNKLYLATCIDKNPTAFNYNTEYYFRHFFSKRN